MSSNEVKCIMCKNSTLEEPLLGFKNEVFEKYVYSAKTRKSTMKKFIDLDIPETMQNIYYHSTCYSAFTAIPKKYKEKYEEIYKNDNQPVVENETNLELERTLSQESHASASSSVASATYSISQKSDLSDADIMRFIL